MAYRLRGTLERLTDDDRRPLRPIGMSVREAASRTGSLLERLTDIPGVRIFAGVRIAHRGPRIGFAASTASHVLLVESVAWPSGEYTVAPEGRVFCDGVFIGQSVEQLRGSVSMLRRQTRRRVVGAVVVVHPSAGGRPLLPVRSPAGPTWLSPDELCLHLARTLRLRTYCRNDIKTAMVDATGSR